MNGMLTKRQQQIYDFIRKGIAQGQGPTLREIQKHFRFSSPASVTSHLTLMEKKGVIRRKQGCARNIALTVEEPLAQSIPLLGSIPAGLPVATEESIERYLAMDAASLALSKNAETFALRVKGDSMVDAAILDGDLVILEVREPRHGDIVAALIDQEVTLKRYLLQKGRPFLRAENSKYPDLLPATELVIQGVLRAVLRIQK